MFRKWLLAWVFLAFISPGPVRAGQEDAVVARIGDETITMSSLEAEYEGTPKEYRERQLKDPKTLNRLVNSVVERKVLAICAGQKGLDQDPKIKSRIRIQTETILAEAYTRVLKAEIKAGTTADEAEVSLYYEKHPKEFMTKGRIRLQFIAVKKQNEAEQIVAQLKKGADFAALAKKHSIHPSGNGGGNLGWIEYGKQFGLEPAIARAVRELDAGSTSGILRLRDQYCVVKVAEREPPAPIPLKDVARKIEQIIRNQKENEAMAGAIAERMKAMNVQIMVEKAESGAPSPK